MRWLVKCDLRRPQRLQRSLYKLECCKGWGKFKNPIPLHCAMPVQLLAQLHFKKPLNRDESYGCMCPSHSWQRHTYNTAMSLAPRANHTVASQAP